MGISFTVKIAKFCFVRFLSLIGNFKVVRSR